MPETLTKGERTRQRIIEQAAPVFNQRGFDGTSMQHIMEATGLEKGGIYRHFDSKENLATEAFRYARSSSLKTRLSSLEEASGNAPEQLHRLVDRFVDARPALAGGCPLMNTAIDADDGNPELRKLAAEAFTAWRTRIGAIVESGQHSGTLRRRITPEHVADMLIATLEGSLMLSRVHNSRSPLEHARASLHDYINGMAK